MRKVRKREFSERVKRFIVRYTWAAAGIAFLCGTALGTGAVWSYLDHQLKIREMQDRELSAVEDMRAKLEDLRIRLAQTTTSYIKCRDKYFTSQGYDFGEAIAERPSRPNTDSMLPEDDFYQTQNEFFSTEYLLRGQVEEYNRLESALSEKEKRDPIWYYFLDPPVPMTGLKVEPNVDKKKLHLSWSPPKSDPIEALLNEDLKLICQQGGKKYEAIDFEKPPPGINFVEGRYSRVVGITN